MQATRSLARGSVIGTGLPRQLAYLAHVDMRSERLYDRFLLLGEEAQAYSAIDTYALRYRDDLVGYIRFLEYLLRLHHMADGVE